MQNGAHSDCCHYLHYFPALVIDRGFLVAMGFSQATPGFKLDSLSLAKRR